MKFKKLVVLLAVIGMVGCEGDMEVEPWTIPEQNMRTATPLPVLGIMQHSLGLEVMPSPTPTQVPTKAPILELRLFRDFGVSAAGVLGTEQWRGLVSQYFPPESVDAVLSIMQCESGGNPDATNGVHQGLMQTNVNYHQAKADALFGPGRSLYEPEVNIAVSAVISGGYNWGAWSCKP